MHRGENADKDDEEKYFSHVYYTHKVGHLCALLVVVVGIVESKSIIDQTFITSMFANGRKCLLK